MIDAEFRSEEMFSRLSLAYETENEKQSVCNCVEKVTAKYSLKPETYITKVSNGKEVLVIEYHDDRSRATGDIFEEMIKFLDIKICN